jgi:hypothetical protein
MKFFLPSLSIFIATLFSVSTHLHYRLPTPVSNPDDILQFDESLAISHIRNLSDPSAPLGISFRIVGTKVLSILLRSTNSRN